MQNIWIHPEKCDGCGLCAEACPHGCLALHDDPAFSEHKTAFLYIPRRCSGCESCVSVCPCSAIEGYKL